VIVRPRETCRSLPFFVSHATPLIMIEGRGELRATASEQTEAAHAKQSRRLRSVDDGWKPRRRSDREWQGSAGGIVLFSSGVDGEYICRESQYVKPET
jgi:hypothetical protein